MYDGIAVPHVGHWMEGGGYNGCPQWLQNLFSLGLPLPHFEHMITCFRGLVEGFMSCVTYCPMDNPMAKPSPATKASLTSNLLIFTVMTIGSLP